MLHHSEDSKLLNHSTNKSQPNKYAITQHFIMNMSLGITRLTRACIFIMMKDSFISELSEKYYCGVGQDIDGGKILSENSKLCV